MVTKNKAIDTYIERSADFAKPILRYIRQLVHNTCPEVEEKIKWGFPHFDYRNGMMCSMAAFKQHCAFTFWKAAIMKDPILVRNARTEQAMGHLGRITSLKDLPKDRQLIAWIKEAMKLNEQGVKLPPKIVTKEKNELDIPPYFTKALSANKKALQTFDKFPYSHKKEYLVWITGAKTEETRNKRMARALELMAEGKSQNWKYARK